MNPEDITAHLTKRLEQVAEWGKEGFSPSITGLKLRDFPCTAMPLRQVTSDDRKEKYGLICRLTWPGPDGDFFADVDVRLNIDGSFSIKGERKLKSNRLVIGPCILFSVKAQSA